MIPLGASISQCGSIAVCPVVSQYTESVWIGDHQVRSLPSMQLPSIQLVWRWLFELNWFHMHCNLKYTKTIVVLIPRACTEWCWSTHTLKSRTGMHHWRAINSKWKLNLQRPVHLLPGGAPSSCHLVIISNWHGCYAALLYICVCVCGIPAGFQCTLNKPVYTGSGQRALSPRYERKTSA